MTKIYKIKDFLKRIKNSIEIEDGVLYKRVTVSGNHKGVSLRDIKDGFKIGTKKQFTISGGDFILSKIDARNGAFGIIPDDLDGAIITGNFWTYKVDNELVNSEWFFYFTHSFNFIQLCIESSTGSTHRKYLNEQVFLNQNIFLPKIAEQVAMVEKYKQKSKISANLKREIILQKQLVSKLKQSILQDAIQGELTKDWRKENPTVEPATELLKRIKAEKAQLVKEKKIRKEKPLPAIENEEVYFELPEGWVWTKLGNLCSKTGSGKTPRGGQSVYSSEGVKFIRSQNVYNEGLVLNGIAYISETIHLEMNSSEIQPEDLLLNITGGSIGRCCIVPKDLDTANVNQHVAIIRPVFSGIGYFIHNVILSSYFQSEIVRAQTGAGREGLPKNKMDNILIPIPPLEEQKAIVQRVETLLQKCTALEQEIAKSEVNAEMLMQAVLKEAFEGKEDEQVETINN